VITITEGTLLTSVAIHAAQRTTITQSITQHARQLPRVATGPSLQTDVRVPMHKHRTTISVAGGTTVHRHPLRGLHGVTLATAATHSGPLEETAAAVAAPGATEILHGATTTTLAAHGPAVDLTPGAAGRAAAATAARLVADHSAVAAAAVVAPAAAAVVVAAEARGADTKSTAGEIN
jgi:hypothetical protein